MSSPIVEGKSRVLVVGGGFVGFLAARLLQKKIVSHGWVVTVVDPLPHMTYQPFLPEVIGGGVQPEYAVVPLRKHLKRSEVINGKIVRVDHDRKVAVVETKDGVTFNVPYDEIIIAAGAITRTFPVEGLAEHGISVKSIEEAVGIHTQVLECLERACLETDESKRRRLLSFVVVGGGFNGVETMGELQNMVVSAAKQNDLLNLSELRFVLVEALGRVMPEVSEKQSQYVLDSFHERGIEVYLSASLDGAEGGVMRLVGLPDKKVVEEFEAETLIWTAGVQANPMVNTTGFPLEKRGRVRVNAALQIIGERGVIEGAWAAGDAAAVPDLTGGGVNGFCIPNAQHAMRQAKRLAKNLLAAQQGGRIIDYKHKSLGVVAGLGLYRGVAIIIFGVKIPLRGFLAWCGHRVYHGLAMPTWERKLRVMCGWVGNWVLRRNISYLPRITQPRANFEYAARGSKPRSGDKREGNE